MNLYTDGITKPPTDEACEREQREALRPTLDLPMVALTCPACDSHNVTDTDLGRCGDCGLSDNLSAFTGGGMTAKAKFQPSRFAQGGGSARTFESSSPRGWSMSGGVD